MRERLILVGCAAVVIAVGWLDLVQHYQLGGQAALLLSILRALPLALASRRPEWAFRGTVVATLVTAAVSHPVSPSEPWPYAVTSVFAAIPVLVLIGMRESRGVQVAVWLTVPVLGVIAQRAAPGRGDWEDILAPTAVAAVALIGGVLLRRNAEARQGLEEQQLRTDAERAGREVLQERTRLARELHDVIAHGLSEVTVRADSAPARLGGVDPAVAAEFDAIAESARGALTDLRQVLGVLRDPDAGSGTAPLPGLAELPALAGENALSVDADPALVPSAVQLAAYRVVQEALSNVRKHAPGVLASVSVVAGADGLRVTVTNPASRAADPAPGHGYGLAGMRERAAIVGGSLEAGPAPGGGWRVAAALPLTQGES